MRLCFRAEWRFVGHPVDPVDETFRIGRARVRSSRLLLSHGRHSHRAARHDRPSIVWPVTVGTEWNHGPSKRATDYLSSWSLVDTESSRSKKGALAIRQILPLGLLLVQRLRLQ